MIISANSFSTLRCLLSNPIENSMFKWCSRSLIIFPRIIRAAFCSLTVFQLDRSRTMSLTKRDWGKKALISQPFPHLSPLCFPSYSEKDGDFPLSFFCCASTSKTNFFYCLFTTLPKLSFSWALSLLILSLQSLLASLSSHVLYIFFSNCSWSAIQRHVIIRKKSMVLGYINSSKSGTLSTMSDLLFPYSFSAKKWKTVEKLKLQTSYFQLHSTSKDKALDRAVFLSSFLLCCCLNTGGREQ